MKEQRLIYIKKTDQNNTPIGRDFACLDCPSAGWTNGFSGTFLNQLRKNFENQIIKVKKNEVYNNENLYREMIEEVIDDKASHPSNYQDFQSFKKSRNFTENDNEEDLEADYEVYKEEMIVEARMKYREDRDNLNNALYDKIAKSTISEIWTIPENHELFAQYVEEQKRNSLNCYCKEQHQYTFKGNQTDYIHILDCDFKDKLINNERINSAMSDINDN